jgi:hypothetical protein
MALLGKKKTPEELQLTAEAREAERE